ncbi:TPA: hypothetical protein EYP70_06855, partial [Candidatus Bathyarchaeota archaeon]|nr:hypothetical protein [Candidatus Bathyarchaeota archaeon]
MACNGYNHPPDCDCGWGGENYGNNTGSNASTQNNSDFQIKTYESFTVPNIRCKCCGDEIYFHQTSCGGKVFFDELGHPWEKHCCEPKCCAKEIIGNESQERMGLIIDEKHLEALKTISER